MRTEKYGGIEMESVRKSRYDNGWKISERAIKRKGEGEGSWKRKEEK